MKQIKGLTPFSILYDIVVFGGFICANKYAVAGLLTAFSWFFWFIAVLAIASVLTNSLKSPYQYTLVKFRYELITNLLLGFMLAFYGEFVLASILAFWGVLYAQLSYFRQDGGENESK